MVAIPLQRVQPTSKGQSANAQQLCLHPPLIVKRYRVTEDQICIIPSTVCKKALCGDCIHGVAFYHLGLSLHIMEPLDLRDKRPNNSQSTTENRPSTPILPSLSSSAAETKLFASASVSVRAPGTNRCRKNLSREKRGSNNVL